MPWGQGLFEAAPGGQVQVEVKRLGVRPLHRRLQALAGASDHGHRNTVPGDGVGQVGGLEVPVPGRVHLLAAVQVEPELKAFHQACLLLRDFRMDDAPARRHPLHATVLQQAFMARAVAVQHAPGDHVGDGLEASVRMVGEAGDVVVGLVAAKGVQHQKRVQPLLQVLGQHTGQLDTGTVRGGLALDQAFDGAGAGDGGDGVGRGRHGVLGQEEMDRRPPL